MFGGGTVLLSEVMGALGILRVSWIGVAWCALAAVSLACAKPATRSLRALFAGFDWRGTIRGNPILVGLVVLTGVIAWVSPPTNYDAMTYHLPRVMHWLQQGSLDHFATHDIRQVSYWPGAAYWQIHLWALFDGDRGANVPQWLAYCGCLVAATDWLKRYTSNYRFSVLAAATLPMAVLQATSSQTDLLGTCWVVAFLALATGGRPLVAGLAAGLAVMTKPTAGFCLAPFFLAWVWLERPSRRKAAALVVIAVLPCLPHALRNSTEFGNPLGPSAGVLVDSVRLPALAVNGARWLTLSVPAAPVWDAVAAGARAMGEDPSDPATTFFVNEYISPPEILARFLLPDEDFAGYSLALLALGALVLVASTRRRLLLSRSNLGWLFAAVAALAVHVALLKWQIWGNRLILPAAFLGTAAVASAVDGDAMRGLCRLLGGAFAANAVVMLVFSLNRPIVRVPDYLDFTGGQRAIFTASRDDVFLSGYRGRRRDKLEKVVRFVTDHGFHRVGLNVNVDFPEYVLWWAFRRINYPVELYHSNPVKTKAEHPRPELDAEVTLAW